MNLKNKDSRQHLKAIAKAALICFSVIFFLTGCETCKGFGRDLKSIQKGDDWFREHAW